MHSGTCVQAYIYYTHEHIYRQEHVHTDRNMHTYQKEHVHTERQKHTLIDTDRNGYTQANREYTHTKTHTQASPHSLLKCSKFKQFYFFVLKQLGPHQSSSIC